MLGTSFSSTVVGCGIETEFDILTTAGLYSQLSGVLAGFAFAALVVVLTAQLQDRADRDDRVAVLTAAAARVEVIVKPDRRLSDGSGGGEARRRGPNEASANAALVLTVAVFGLVLSAIAYAILAGGRYSGPRAAVEEVIVGGGLVTSTTVLFYAIVLLFDAAERQSHVGRGMAGGAMLRAAGWLRAAFAFWVTPLSSAYLASAAYEYFHARWPEHDWVMWPLYGLLILPVLSAIVGRRRRIDVGGDRHERGVQGLTRFGSAVFGCLTAAFVIADGMWEPCASPPLAMIIAALATANAFLCLAAWRFANDPRPGTPAIA